MNEFSMEIRSINAKMALAKDKFLKELKGSIVAENRKQVYSVLHNTIHIIILPFITLKYKSTKIYYIFALHY